MAFVAMYATRSEGADSIPISGIKIWAHTIQEYFCLLHEVAELFFVQVDGYNVRLSPVLIDLLEAVDNVLKFIRGASCNSPYEVGG